jgi:biotin carboxyl carrier protein
MPGKIVTVQVKPGQNVEPGDVLVIVEAMKMEHAISCSEAGIVKEVRVSAGAQVEAGEVLLVVETTEKEE